MSGLGDYIVSLREKKGWNTRELARQAKINHESLRKIEIGETKNPGIGTIIEIAKALNADVSLLILAYKGKEPVIVTHNYDELFKKAFIDVFIALPREEKIELMGDAFPKLLQEARKIENQEKDSK